MFFRDSSFRFVLKSLLSVGLVAGAVSSANAGSAFAPFVGSWSGEGTITVASGNNERIRCKATYAVDASGSSLQQQMRCASDSYKLEVSANVTESGGNLSGTWNELTRSAMGNLSGHVSNGDVQASIIGPGFTAGLALAVRGKTQSVMLRPQGGTDIRDVRITMKK